MANITPYQKPGGQRANTTLPPNATDELAIKTWLHGRPLTTQESYRSDIAALCEFTEHKPLQLLTLVDLQDWEDSMAGQASTSIARRLSAIKSLLTFCYKAGYTGVNVGAALRLPSIESKLAERIMSQAQIQKMLALEVDPRTHAILRVLYNAGLRVSEVIRLTWNDVQSNTQGGQLHIFGKGGKERYVVISKETN